MTMVITNIMMMTKTNIVNKFDNNKINKKIV